MAWQERARDVVERLRGGRSITAVQRDDTAIPRPPSPAALPVRVGSTELDIDLERVQGPVTTRIHRYLDGEPVTFEAAVDLNDRTAFQRQVLQAIRDVPYGDTVTYGELAERIGKPNATHAVAQACGSNPVPIVIPCHRVVAKNGLGGYSDGGPPVKARLLALER